MKKTILLLLLVPIISTSILAQGPVNGDFEDWYQTQFQHKRPDFWLTSTDVIRFPTNVFQNDDNPYTGLYCAYLVSVQKGPIAVPGIVAIANKPGDDESFNFAPGDSMTYRPDSIAGFYEYAPKGGEKFYVYLMLSKWNGTSRDTIGGGGFSSGDTVQSYKKFSAKIHYLTNDYPDSIQLIVSTAKDYTKATAGTEAFVDSIHFIGTNTPTTGIKDLEGNNNLYVYPNPTNQTIKVHGLLRNTEYKVLDIIGNKLLTGEISSHQNEIRVETLNAGIYYLVGENFIKKFTVL